MRRLALLLAAFAVSSLSAFAQTAGDDVADDDKTILENFLQNNLSAAGRTVVVTGFRGALSSRATMERLTVADDEGIWLTIEGAELDWTRSALLTGRLEIDALTAERIEVARRPVAVTDGAQPTTSDFAQPELPVSINIGEISTPSLVLGEPVLGVGAELGLAGRGRLVDGAGEAKIMLERVDGETAGRFDIAAGYANETGILALDLDLEEGAGGIVATLTSLPGAAPLAFSLKGTGPVDDYTADLSLATNGAERIGGRVTLDRAAPGGPLHFAGNLAGDPTPLMTAEYRGFFGTDVALDVEGLQRPDGRLDLTRLDIAAEALRLSGSALIAPGGWPERIDLTGAVVASDGSAVRLPLGGEPTWVDKLALTLAFDADRGDDWQADITLDGLSRPDMRLARATLQGRGTLTPGNGGLPAFGGHVALAATGLTGTEGSAPAALGPDLSGSFDLARTSGDTLAFTNLTLGGADYRLTGDVTLDTVVERLDLVADGAVTLAAEDLSRFAALAGQDLTGAARLRVAGTAALPGGPFDVEITGTGQDLGIGIAEADRLFAGASTFALSAARTREGTEIDRFDIRAPGATATGTGWLAETGSQLALRLDLPDGGMLADGLEGRVSVQATALQRDRDWDLSLDASAPGGTRVEFAGTAIGKRRGIAGVKGELSGSTERLAAWSGLAGRPLSGSATFTAGGQYNIADGNFTLTGKADGQGLDFDLGSADRLTRGASALDFEIRRNKRAVFIVDRFSLETPELSLNAEGRAKDEMPRIAFDGRLRDLGQFVPGLPGAFTLSGNANLTETGWEIRASGDGPGGTAINASGTVAGDARSADLALRGRAPLALVNDAIAPRALSGMAAFDLRVNGPLALGSVSGNVTTQGARAALPTFAIALDPLTANLRLSAGQASVDASATVSSGGRLFVRGPVALSGPYAANLAIEARDVRLRDENLYDATVSGNLALAGALAGGASITGGLRLGDVELRIPETGFSASGGLEGLRHVGAPPAVRTTLSRAGLNGSGNGGGGGGTEYGLGISISAPSAVFIRGRGLDAELGGSLTVGGTTRNVVTTGGVNLIRGRLDILGNRLALTEGAATLRGSLDPTLSLRAETNVDDVAIGIAVEGLASNPRVTFTSSPDLPEDEILARLVFGRGIDQISAFQAVKLASAVATLSGRGGAGTISRLREGFGLDDLDVTTDAEGDLEVSAGTYISDNIYTDVTVGADGRAEVNLNLTITPSVTARGSVGSDGSTGIGVYFEKDY